MKSFFKRAMERLRTEARDEEAEREREARLASAAATLRAVKARGWWFPGDEP
jgi:hypothetical protein